MSGERSWADLDFLGQATIDELFGSDGEPSFTRGAAAADRYKLTTTGKINLTDESVCAKCLRHEEEIARLDALLFEREQDVAVNAGLADDYQAEAQELSQELSGRIIAAKEAYDGKVREYDEMARAYESLVWEHLSTVEENLKLKNRAELLVLLEKTREPEIVIQELREKNGRLEESNKRLVADLRCAEDRVTLLEQECKKLRQMLTDTDAQFTPRINAEKYARELAERQLEHVEAQLEQLHQTHGQDAGQALSREVGLRSQVTVLSVALSRAVELRESEVAREAARAGAGPSGDVVVEEWRDLLRNCVLTPRVITPADVRRHP